MERLKSFFKSKLVIALSAVVLVTFFTISLVKASTTIGNDINTAGQLIVSGLANLNGGIKVNNGVFTVDNEGQVGIGTITPTMGLEIASGNLKFSNYTYPAIYLGSDVTALDIRKQGDSNNWLDIYPDGIAGSYSTSTNKFKITTSGNSYINGSGSGYFGIGTITPTAKLDVNGTTKISGDVNINDLLYVKHDGINGYFVGIGTANPTDYLDIHGNLTFSGPMYPDIRLGAGVDALSVRSLSNNDNFIDISEKYLAGFQDANNRFQITTYNNENSYISTGGNFGVGTISPTAKLEVNGGMKLNTVTVKPVCTYWVRGTFWVTQGDTDVADSVEVCAKDAGNAYAWRTIY